MLETLRRVSVILDGGRRVTVNPEGGLSLEHYVQGFGWCVLDDGGPTDAELLDVLNAAAALLSSKAQDLAVTGCRSWTPDEILAREG